MVCAMARVIAWLNLSVADSPASAEQRMEGLGIGAVFAPFSDRSILLFDARQPVRWTRETLGQGHQNGIGCHVCQPDRAGKVPFDAADQSNKADVRETEQEDGDAVSPSIGAAHTQNEQAQE